MVHLKINHMTSWSVTAHHQVLQILRLISTAHSHVTVLLYYRNISAFTLTNEISLQLKSCDTGHITIGSLTSDLLYCSPQLLSCQWVHKWPFSTDNQYAGWKCVYTVASIQLLVTTDAQREFWTNQQLCYRCDHSFSDWASHSSLTVWLVET